MIPGDKAKLPFGLTQFLVKKNPFTSFMFYISYGNSKMKYFLPLKFPQRQLEGTELPFKQASV
jgi:hypothetical protein